MEHPEQEEQSQEEVNRKLMLDKPTTVYEWMDSFVLSRSYIRPKLIKGRLFCDNCGCEFPINNEFYIKLDDANEKLWCYPCDFNKTGENPHTRNIEYRKKLEEQNVQRRFEREFAYRLALELVAQLKPYCEFIEIAGSIRRKKLDVKDIEIVALPKMDEDASGFFESVKVRSRGFISEVKKLGKIVKGSPDDGRYVQIELPKEIKLDLFIPTETDYIRQFVIRTGSGNFAKNDIAAKWVVRGWVGTEDGLRRTDQCIQKGKTWVCVAANPVLPPVWKTEKEFFQWLGVDYVEPEKRNT